MDQKKSVNRVTAFVFISKTPEMTEHFSRYLQISDVIYRYQIFEEKMELVYIAALTEITFLSEIYGIVKIAEV